MSKIIELEHPDLGEYTMHEIPWLDFVLAKHTKPHRMQLTKGGKVYIFDEGFILYEMNCTEKIFRQDLIG